MKKFNWLSGSLVLAFALFAKAGHAEAGYTVHEWGTFTDVQGADGALLSWRPLETSELPGFVRDWKNPGMNRKFAGLFIGKEPTVVTGMKETMVTLQRLETPVMYFYSDKDLAVDVSVRFPGGIITEWYPQATQMGPSVPLDTNASSAATLRDIEAKWTHLMLLPDSKHNSQFQSQMPADKLGNHYFAARQTAADTVRMDFADGTARATNFEKFIFYRGAGSFKTPLQVSVNAQNEVAVGNTGNDPLTHLFLLRIKNGGGSFEEMAALPHGGHKPFSAVDAPDSAMHRFGSLAEGQAELGTAMRAAMESAGLFPDEAAAMVNTWKDSWFAEDGVRVLYLLPRAWTDETLPLTLRPRPQNIVRVMVGRAEVIMPETEKRLADALAKAEAGNDSDRQNAVAELKHLGRFAEPTLQLVDHAKKSSAVEFDFQLLTAITPGN